MESNVLLTFLIPTYNRAPQLNGLLYNLRKLILQHTEHRFEILVSDNYSTDNTETVVRRHSDECSCIRYIKPTIKSDTGEENLLPAMAICEGKYIWSLSDDCVLYSYALDEIIPYLLTDKYPIFHLNFNLYTWYGEDYSSSAINNPELYEYKSKNSIYLFSELVKDIGMMSTLACFGSRIVRKDYIVNIDYKKYLDLSIIYSHVVFWIEAFAKLPVLFIARPVFTQKYEGVEETNKRFSKYTKEHNLQKLYPWGIGLLKLINALHSTQTVTPDFYFNIIEINVAVPHNRFRLVPHTLSCICDQINLWMDTEEDREAISICDMEMAVELFSKADQRQLGLILKLYRIVQMYTIIAEIAKNDALKASTVLDDLDFIDRCNPQDIIAALQATSVDSINTIRQRLKNEVDTTKSIILRNFSLSGRDEINDCNVVKRFAGDLLKGIICSFCLKRVVIWPYNDICNALLNVYPQLNENIIAILDSNPDFHGQKVLNTNCYVQSPTSFSFNECDVVIIASKDYASEITKELREKYNYLGEVLALGQELG